MCLHMIDIICENDADYEYHDKEITERGENLKKQFAALSIDCWITKIDKSTCDFKDDSSFHNQVFITTSILFTDLCLIFVFLGN